MGVPLLNQPKVDGPDMRVLYCLVCGTLEELPLFDGHPDNDHLLGILLEHHVFPSGEPHKGHLFRVPQLQWESQTIRMQIINQIKAGGSKGIAEFDATFYDTKNTFKEDAMKCFAQHLRPKDGCPDYMSESKILLPDTKAERKAEGLPSPKSAPGPKNHLCSFCPVHSTVTTKINELRAK